MAAPHPRLDRRSSAQRRWRTRCRSLRGAFDGRAAGRGRGAREEHPAPASSSFPTLTGTRPSCARSGCRTAPSSTASHPGTRWCWCAAGTSSSSIPPRSRAGTSPARRRSPPGGEIGHDPDGSLNGELVDTARSLVKLPPPPKLTPEALEAQMKLLNAVGLTGVRIPGGFRARPRHDRPLPHVPAIEGAGAAHHARELPDAHLRLLERGEGEGDHRLVERAPGRRRRVAEDRRHEDAGRRRLRGWPHARALRRTLRTRREGSRASRWCRRASTSRSCASSIGWAGASPRTPSATRRWTRCSTRTRPERRALDRRKALDDRALLRRQGGPVPDREGAGHRDLGAGPPLPRGVSSPTSRSSSRSESRSSTMPSRSRCSPPRPGDAPRRAQRASARTESSRPSSTRSFRSTSSPRTSWQPVTRRPRFAAADFVLESEYRVGHQEQLYIENNAMIAVPGDDGGVTVHGSLQCPYYVHTALKRGLGSTTARPGSSRRRPAAASAARRSTRR